MKVLFAHADPFLLAHGGFQTQIEQTARALSGIGVNVEMLKWWDARQRGDLIHYFGRPHPDHIRMAHRAGIKYVFTELLTSQGSRADCRLAIQSMVGWIARSFAPRNLSEKIGWESYRTADAVVSLTDWEKGLMSKLYGADPEKIHIVPNGVEEVFFQSNPRTVEIPAGLICTATIAERKRVAELARAAVVSEVPLRIVGAPYSETAPYFHEFLDVVKKSGGIVRYSGPIDDRPALASAYRGALGFVLLSSMESQSLSALEAAAIGLPLLLSDLPWARETFGGAAQYCPVRADVNTIAVMLREFRDAAARLPRPSRPPSWIEVANLLKTVYSHALAS